MTDAIFDIEVSAYFKGHSGKQRACSSSVTIYKTLDCQKRTPNPV
jgi:hypothetical protein